MSQAQNKVFVAMVGVVFHEMPKNRTRTNVYHGLGNTFRIFTEAHSQSSAEQYNLHESLLWRWGKLNQEVANVKSSAQEFFCLRNPRPTWVQPQQVEKRRRLAGRGILLHSEFVTTRKSLRVPPVALKSGRSAVKSEFRVPAQDFEDLWRHRHHKKSQGYPCLAA